MKYEVQAKFVFSGVFLIEAESAAKAKELVQNECGLVMGMDIETSLYKEDCDWDFDPHAETVTGMVRRTIGK